MVLQLSKYMCEVCNNIYDTYEEARRCEDRGIEYPNYKVGDRVKIVYEHHNFYGLIGTITDISYHTINIVSMDEPHKRFAEIKFDLEEFRFGTVYTKWIKKVD